MIDLMIFDKMNRYTILSLRFNDGCLDGFCQVFHVLFVDACNADSS